MAKRGRDAEYELQEVEISDVSDIVHDTSHHSEVTEIDEEDQLQDYEKTLKKTVTKAKINKGILSPSTISFEPEG